MFVECSYKRHQEFLAGGGGVGDAGHFGGVEQLLVNRNQHRGLGWIGDISQGLQEACSDFGQGTSDCMRNKITDHSVFKAGSVLEKS